jgi:hypothetical protein
MIAATIGTVIRRMEKDGLHLWIIKEGRTELARQDDNIAVTDSVDLLTESVAELQQNCEPGDMVNITVMNKQITEKGRDKGTIVVVYPVLLKSKEVAGRVGMGSSKEMIDAIRENEKLKAQISYEKKERELNARIEALENKESDDSDGIGSIEKIINHPTISLLLGNLFGNKPPQAPINGAPTNLDGDLEYLKNNDSTFGELVHAVRLIMEKDRSTYDMSKNMIIQSSKNY